MLARHNELPIFEEGQPLDDPIPCLIFLKAFPFVGSEELIAVRQAQVLAEQAPNLCFRTDWKVTQC